MIGLRKKIVFWYVLWVALCCLATASAYHGPLSSDAWRVWSGAGAWKVDTLLALLIAVLALFVLWNLEEEWLRTTITRAKLHPLEKTSLAFSLLALAYSNFFWLPPSFREGLTKDHPEISQSFPQIMLPYFPYFIYVVGIYIGLILPVFFALVRRLIDDWRDCRSAWSRFILAADQVSTQPRTRCLQELALSFQDYVVQIRRVSEHFLPALLAVSLGLTYEQLTPSHKTVTPAAIDGGKFALWVLMVPSLLTCVALVGLGYQKAVRVAETALRAVRQTVGDSEERAALLEQVIGTRADLLWNHTPAGFVITVVGSASIAIPLFLAVTGYVLKTIAGTNEWLDIFLPKVIIKFFHDLYQ